MKLKIGIFFDGTGCNANNSMCSNTLDPNTGNLKQHQDIASNSINATRFDEMGFEKQINERCNIPSSYRYAVNNFEARENTNIWALYCLYKRGRTSEGFQLAIYINGCGTEDNQENDLFTMATGWSLPLTGIKRGVIDKTDIAVDLIKSEFNKLLLSGEFIFKSIEFELFGFSRGAASARHLANRIARNDIKLRQVIKQFFTNESYKSIKNYPCGKISFMGLFDTVAAILALNQLDFDINSSKTGDVNIELNSNIAENIFHITAGHEIKYCYSLNTILPNFVAELELPGCHIDIGGGHPDVVDEALFISKPYYSMEFGVNDEQQSTAYKQAEKEYNLLINHRHWGEIFQRSKVEIVSWKKQIFFNLYLHGSAVISSRNNVCNGIEKIALNAMLQYAELKGCHFNSQIKPDIPAKLSPFHLAVTNAVNQLAEQKSALSLVDELPAELAREFVHCEFFWTEPTNNEQLAVKGIDISSPEFFDIIFTNRPTDNLVRSRYDSFGKMI